MARFMIGDQVVFLSIMDRSVGVILNVDKSQASHSHIRVDSRSSNTIMVLLYWTLSKSMTLINRDAIEMLDLESMEMMHIT